MEEEMEEELEEELGGEMEEIENKMEAGEEDEEELKWLSVSVAIQCHITCKLLKNLSWL